MTTHYKFINPYGHLNIVFWKGKQCKILDERQSHVLSMAMSMADQDNIRNSGLLIARCSIITLIFVIRHTFCQQPEHFCRMLILKRITNTALLVLLLAKEK